MRKNPYQGKFIVFDSLDGAGNSTQAKLLVDWLKKKGIRAHLTKEPTATLIGGLIKSQLARDWKSSALCLQLLFAADRAYHLEKEVLPLLKRGVWVVCDRYFFSSFAYGNVKIKDWEWLLKVNEKFIFPDLTFFLKVGPKKCLERIKKDRFEITLFENEKILKKVWENYEKIAQNFKNLNVFVVDGEKEIKTVFAQIKRIVEKNFFI